VWHRSLLGRICQRSYWGCQYDVTPTVPEGTRRLKLFANPFIPSICRNCRGYASIRLDLGQNWAENWLVLTYYLHLHSYLSRNIGMMTATGLACSTSASFRVLKDHLIGIVALFSLLSAASRGAGGSITGTLAALSAFRFLLGIGVGAEYPCGSVAAAEQSEGEGIAKNAQHRWFALATNTMIDFGFVVAAFVPLVLLWIFKENHLRAIWRISLGLGFVPAVAVFIWRLSSSKILCHANESYTGYYRNG